MILAQRFPIERVASAIVTVWGICLILTTVCHNYQALYAQRFFLGFLESGISPMFMMIVVRIPSNVHHVFLDLYSVLMKRVGKFLQKE